MTLPRDAVIDLMAYADGELEGDALARVEAMLASNEEARSVVDSMRTLGDAVRGAHDAFAPKGGVVDSIADDVMAKIDGAKPAAGVAGGAEMRALVSLAEKRAAMRARVTMAGASMFAIAAAVFLFLHSSGPPAGPVADESPHETAPVVQPAPGASTPPAGDLPSTLANAATEVDLESVESAEHRVSVFYIPKTSGAAGGATATGAAGASPSSIVIWIDDHAQGASGGH